MKQIIFSKTLLLILFSSFLFGCIKNDMLHPTNEPVTSNRDESVTGTETLKDGLAAYYPFTGEAKDHSGNHNNGTVYNATLTKDRFGNLKSAYKFNGSAYILVPGNSSLDLTGNFSISSWFRMSAYATFYNASTILSKHDGDIGKDGYMCGIWNINHDTTSQIVNFQANDHWNPDTYPGPEGIVKKGRWYHFVVTYDNTNAILKYYLNDNLIFSKNIKFYVLPNNLNLSIGYNKSSYGTYLDYFNGTLDEIRIYNRVLTKGEVTRLYQQ